jgi:hypothetical protein
MTSEAVARFMKWRNAVLDRSPAKSWALLKFSAAFQTLKSKSDDLAGSLCNHSTRATMSHPYPSMHHHPSQSAPSLVYFRILEV